MATASFVRAQWESHFGHPAYVKHKTHAESAYREMTASLTNCLGGARVGGGQFHTSLRPDLVMAILFPYDDALFA